VPCTSIRSSLLKCCPFYNQ